MAIFGKKNIQTDAQFDILPKNIGIIMDGNGRWAKKRALPRSAGHKAGAEVFRTISKECGRLGLESATFYAFSTENWKRPKEEVDAIMHLFKDYLLEAKSDITAAGNMKMKFIGEREGMSKELLDLMDEAEEDTSNNTPLLRNSGSNFHADAAMQNTVPTSHSCSCARWNRSSQILSDRRHTNSFCNRCWCRWLPAGFATPMYGCRNPGRCPTHKHRIRGSW